MGPGPSRSGVPLFALLVERDTFCASVHLKEKFVLAPPPGLIPLVLKFETIIL